MTSLSLLSAGDARPDRQPATPARPSGKIQRPWANSDAAETGSNSSGLRRGVSLVSHNSVSTVDSPLLTGAALSGPQPGSTGTTTTTAPPGRTLSVRKCAAAGFGPCSACILPLCEGREPTRWQALCILTPPPCRMAPSTVHCPWSTAKCKAHAIAHPHAVAAGITENSFHLPDKVPGYHEPPSPTYSTASRASRMSSRSASPIQRRRSQSAIRNSLAMQVRCSCGQGAGIGFANCRTSSCVSVGA